MEKFAKELEGVEAFGTKGLRTGEAFNKRRKEMARDLRSAARALLRLAGENLTLGDGTEAAAGEAKGATLVIAKLDRLSRNAAFLLTLRDSGVHFPAVHMPEANDLPVAIMALVAQAEREAISRRTTEALAMAKARGVKLGNPNGAEALTRAGKGAVALRAAVSGNADRFAADLADVVKDIRVGGATSLPATAEALTARGMLTRRGAQWQVSNVWNLIGRLKSAAQTSCQRACASVA